MTGIILAIRYNIEILHYTENCTLLPQANFVILPFKFCEYSKSWILI